MKNIIFFALALIALLNANNLHAQEEEEIIFEESIIYYFNELDYAFYQSYNAFLSGDDAVAGARLNRAAYYVRQEAQSAKAPNKKPIEKQALRLESLADSLAIGRIQSAHKLRKVFAKTHHVLAHDYKLRAAAHWAGEKAEDTGHAMVAAAGHLGHAAKWSGKKIEKGVVFTAKGIGKAGKTVGRGAAVAGVESYRGVRWIGGKMIQGIAFVPTNVGKAIKWLGDGIDKVGEDVEPKPKKKKKNKNKNN